MNNDKKILWDVSSFDWNFFKERFRDKLPEDDNQYRINYTLNHVPLVISALLVNLNKRVEELESEIRELKR
jgi:hypothetical protein